MIEPQKKLLKAITTLNNENTQNIKEVIMMSDPINWKRNMPANDLASSKCH